MSEDIGVISELVAASHDVSGISGVWGEASDDGGLVALLVVEVVGVLRLNECLAVSGKKSSANQSCADGWATVVIELSLGILSGKVIGGKLWRQRDEIRMRSSNCPATTYIVALNRVIRNSSKSEGFQAHSTGRTSSL